MIDDDDDDLRHEIDDNDDDLRHGIDDNDDDSDMIIPHICHFLYTGRIFKFKILHLEITQIYPKKVKYVVFLRSIWKNLHLTEFFTRAAPVVPVTNMRYDPPLKT